MSAQAVLGIREGFPMIARDLIDTVHPALDDAGTDWRFHLRDGSVAAELLAAAIELRGMHGAGATIVIIIGSSQHRMHHAAGSVAAALMHEREFPLLMVPATTASAQPGSRDQLLHSTLTHGEGLR